MDNEQAKLILSAYRHGGEDAPDPIFAEALDQARHDPELGRWLAEQRRFDESMAAALQGVTPPAHLRESLLMNSRIVRFGQPRRSFRHLFARPAPRLALAASIVVFVGAFFLLDSRQAAPLTTDQFVQEVFDLKQSGKISLGKMGGGMVALRTWLAERGSPADFSLPAKLESLGGMGCQTYNIDGHKVSLVCFMLDKDRVVHFFVMDSSGIENPLGTEGTEPVFITQNGLTAATWSADGRTYVLTGKDVDEETLRRLI